MRKRWLSNSVCFSPKGFKLRLTVWSRWKAALFLMLAVVVLLYITLPYIRRSAGPGQRSSCHEKVERCLEDKLRAHSRGRELFDTIVYRHPHSAPGDQQFVPYTGNGYFGISLDDSKGFWVKGRRVLSLATGLNPIVYTAVPSYESQVATVLDVREGVIYRYQCFCNSESFPSVALHVSHEIFAHRTRPGVLVQDIRIYNPSEHDASVSLIQTAPKEWTSTGRLNKDDLPLPSNPEPLAWRTSYKKLAATDEESTAYDGSTASAFMGMAITPQLTNNDVIIVSAGRTEAFHLLSAVRRSSFLSASAFDNYERSDLQRSLIQELKAAARLTPAALKEEHVACWNKLWSSGFSISISKAPDALNGDMVNATMYYVLCNAPSLSTLMPESDLINLLTFKSAGGGVSTAASRESLLALLGQPETCFSGPTETLTIGKLWSSVGGISELNGLVKSWLITLGKHGCSNYLRAGVDGVLQAIVLSMGRLRFSKEHDAIAHVEMQMDPANLHRNLLFRRIMYGNASALVNISVAVGEDNRATLGVRMDRSERDYYACDAECQFPSQSIGQDGVSLPVKVTQPVHPILYITHDKNHIEELKHALHMDAKLAPAHDQQLIALHKHGYSYGGLPLIFWVLLGSLLVAFHLFLFKLIYNECQQTQATPSSSSYYRRRFDS